MGYINVDVRFRWDNPTNNETKCETSDFYKCTTENYY